MRSKVATFDIDFTTFCMHSGYVSFLFNFHLLKLGEESLKGLAVEAGKKALEMAQLEPDDVDLVILCTSTPDDLFGCGSQVITLRLFRPTLCGLNFLVVVIFE